MRGLVFAGHSGGHLFPALSFAQAFKKKHPGSRLVLVTSRKAVKITARMPSGVFSDFQYLPEFPLPSGLSSRTLKFAWGLGLSTVLTFGLIKRENPDFCAGFGSYVSFPGIMLAAWMKIPNFIHEQNLKEGKATRWLARSAGLVAVSFSKTFERAGLKRREVTGLPLRPQFWAAAGQTSDSSSGLFTVLVVGGSQGAQRLNQIVMDAFSLLPPEEMKKVAVIHITGEADYSRVCQKYKSLGIQHEVYPFNEKMEDLYGKAGMAVTRAGANTLFELAAFRLPSIVVPYPHADAHQSDNARFFESQGACRMRDESVLNGNQLMREILELRNNAALRRQMADRLAGISHPDAAERLAGLAAGLLKGRS